MGFYYGRGEFYDRADEKEEWNILIWAGNPICDILQLHASADIIKLE